MQDGGGRLKYVAPFTLVAILVHLGIVLPLIDLIIKIQPADDYSKPFSVDLWDSLSKNSNPKKEKKTPEEELEDYKPQKKNIPDGQLSRSKINNKQRKKKKPRFIAENDNSVARETKSKLQARETSASSQSFAKEGTGKENLTSKGGMKAGVLGVGPTPSDLEKAKNGTVAANMKAAPGLEDINIKPSMQAMAGALSGTGLDKLDDVIEADNTALNTAGWEYASFFNRIKRKVEQRWHPSFAFRKNDPYGNVFGFKDRTTVLLVVLYPDGNLKKLYVMDPCGAPFLDDEAYDAVHDSAPFPNVPEGLKDTRDGLVKFTFHFIVQVGAQPVFRMRRYHP